MRQRSSCRNGKVVAGAVAVDQAKQFRDIPGEVATAPADQSGSVVVVTGREWGAGGGGGGCEGARIRVTVALTKSL